MELIEFTILSFWSLFVIVDPLTTVPTFLAMTRSDTQESKVRMARLASIVTFLVLLVFSIGGKVILNAFGVTMPAFEIAGGIILLKIALDMLQAKRTAIKETPEEQEEGAGKEDIAITPLAVPMMAGPGAITAVVLISSHAVSLFHHLIVIGNIALVSFIAFAILRFSVIRSSTFSAITLRILSRLMGLILAAIAVQFILNGVVQSRLFW